MSGGLYYNPKKKKPKPSLKDRPKATPRGKFKELTPKEKAKRDLRRKNLLAKKKAQSDYRRARAEEYMTKDYRDFPDRKKLEK